MIKSICMALSKDDVNHRYFRSSYELKRARQEKIEFSLICTYLFLFLKETVKNIIGSKEKKYFRLMFYQA